MRSSIETLEYLFKARINCIWVRTYEEVYAINDIKEIFNKLYKGPKRRRNFENIETNLYSWTRTAGITKVQLDPVATQDPPDPKFREFPALFAFIAQEKNKKNGINAFILQDFHSVIDDARAQRYIRDLEEATSNSKNYTPIIVVSPTLNLPDDVAKLFRIIDYELPAADQIKDYAKAIYESFLLSNPEAEQLSDNVLNTVTSCLMGLTLGESINLLKESLIRFGCFDIKFLSENKIENVKKTGVLDYRVPSITLADIGGNENIKEWLLETKLAFNSEAVDFGLDMPKGYMAVGIAGCGKTLLAEAFAGEMNVPLLELSISKIMNKMVGESERKIVQALQVARSCAPCVLLIDECEKVLGGVNSSNQTDSGITARVFQEILKFMNDNNSGVYIIMTSNDVSQLPPELTRAGRLDETWFFGLPDENERTKILDIHFKKKNKDVGEFILTSAAKITEGFTGAEIQQVVKNTMRISFARYMKTKENTISYDDIEKAASEVIPVSQSSKEKIEALERYCKGRARPVSEYKKQKEEGNDFLFDGF